MDIADDIAPTNLETRFKSHARYKKMTTTEARAKVAGEEWKSKWDHPQIFAELTADPPDHTPGEILPYEFDREDDTT